MLAVAWAPPARADLCSDCEKPTESAVREASGTALSGGLRGYGVTGGACTTEMTGKPVRRTRGKIPVWSAHGEAYNCPTGKLTARVSYAIGQDQRFDWSISATVGVEASAALLAKVKAELTKQEGGSGGASQLGTVEQDIEAAFCQRNEYWAIFFATDAEIELEFAVRRTWTWTVYELGLLIGARLTVASGEIETACGTGTVAANRLEPLFFSLGVQTRACRDERVCQGVSGSSVWQGWFPPLPPGLDPFGPKGPFGGQPDPAAPVGGTEPAPGSGGDAPGSSTGGGGSPVGPEGGMTGEPSPVTPGTGTPPAPAPGTPQPGGGPVPPATPAPQGTPTPSSPPEPPPPPPPEAPTQPDDDPPPPDDEDSPPGPPGEEPMSREPWSALGTSSHVEPGAPGASS